MTVVQAGSINTAALNVPGLYVQIQPPPPAINGLRTDILGIVGTGSWGPVNAPFTANGLRSAAAMFGSPNARKYDLVTAAWIAEQQGANNMRLVRVTDGSDTAASAAITATGTAITLSSKYTGTLGNQLKAIMSAGSQANTFKVSLSMPGVVPEVFDNISQGVSGITVTPGTGYTSVPSLALSAPQGAGGVQATASPSLQLVATAPTVAAGGTGYVANDTITLPNGVVLKVATINSGAVATVTVLNSGSITGGAVPANPVAQAATSGGGTGATFTLVWGLGPVTITNPGSGYTSATATLNGGAGTGGSMVVLCTYWLNMANAINLGQSGVRGPSQLMTAVAGAGTGAPTAGTTSLTGGTDGAGSINGSTLVGSDAATPRSGMYALRATGVSVAMLADVDDVTTWAAQSAFGLSEGVYMHVVGPVSDTIANAPIVKANAGVDNYDVKVAFGDYIYFNDTINNQIRLVSPQAFFAGRIANLSPQFSSLNQPMQGIVGTQRSFANQLYSDAEIGVLAQAGIDVITNPIPAGAMFGARIGHNSSSNVAIHGDNYTRMTNFIAYTLNSALGIFVGRLQSKRPDDAYRRELKSTVDTWFDTLIQQVMIDDFQSQCDLNNNLAARIALGYSQIDIKVVYLSVVEYLIANLQGGQTVSIQRVSVTPQPQ